MPSLQELVQDIENKSQKRLGGQRVTAGLPGEDVGFPEYELQAPDVGDALATYSGGQRQFTGGFEGTMAEAEPAPQAQAQPVAYGDAPTPAQQTQCPGGQCPVPGQTRQYSSGMPSMGGGGSSMPTKAVPRKEEPALSVPQQAAAAVTPAPSWMEGVDRDDIEFRAPISGEVTASIPVYDEQQIVQVLDFYRNRQAEILRDPNRAYEATIYGSRAAFLERMIFEQRATIAASATYNNAMELQRQKFLENQPDYGPKAKMQLLGDTSMTPQQAAREAFIYDLAEMGQISLKDTAAGNPEAIQAANEVMRSAEGQTRMTELIRQAQQVRIVADAGVALSIGAGQDGSDPATQKALGAAHTAMVTNLMGMYPANNPAYADMRAVQQDMWNTFSGPLENEFTEYYSGMSDPQTGNPMYTPEMARLMATQSAVEWVNAMSFDVQEARAAGLSGGEGRSATQIIADDFNQFMSQASQMAEDAGAAIGQGIIDASDVASDVYNYYFRSPASENATAE